MTKAILTGQELFVTKAILGYPQAQELSYDKGNIHRLKSYL
jgi:hypothetical protein